MQEGIYMKNLFLMFCSVALLAGCRATGPAPQPGPVAREYQAAQNSIDSLAEFISTHPEHPVLCGGAQMRIGYLLAHREKEKLPEAIRAYQKAIRAYGNLRDVDALAAPATVADVARLKIAVCYKKMGEPEKARASYEAIADEQLKAANRRHFVNEKDINGIEQGAEGDAVNRAP
jgi:tetratricopeptide (TPR) repeat protein